jgi:hypothetical protein
MSKGEGDRMTRFWKNKAADEKESSPTQEIEKKYTQFSKKVVLMCVFNLFAIEIFSMVMMWKTQDTSQISYLITSIAVECLGCVVWYMKNSETEKKTRIQAEVEKEKLKSGGNPNPSSESGSSFDAGVTDNIDDDFQSLSEKYQISNEVANDSSDSDDVG